MTMLVLHQAVPPHFTTKLRPCAHLYAAAHCLVCPCSQPFYILVSYRPCVNRHRLDSQFTKKPNKSVVQKQQVRWRPKHTHLRTFRRLLVPIFICSVHRKLLSESFRNLFPEVQRMLQSLKGPANMKDSKVCSSEFLQIFQLSTKF